MQIAKNMVVRVLTVGKKEEKKRGIEVREEQAIDKEVKEEGGGDRGTSCDEYFQQLDGLDAMAQSIFAGMPLSLSPFLFSPSFFYLFLFLSLLNF